MYMSRLTLSHEQSALNALARVNAKGGYRLHQLVWDLFEDGGGKRPFLYRYDRWQGLPRLMVLSELEPEDKKGVWRIESKPFAPQLTAGELLAFSIRFNPVIKKRDEQRRQHRHDLVMELKKRLAREEVPRLRWPSQAELASRAGAQWLSQRAEAAGFRLQEGALMAEEYRQHRLRKPGKPPIQFSTLDCSGLLTVVDSQLFLQTLKAGLGPAKGFGCGLLLVRRVASSMVEPPLSV